MDFLNSKTWNPFESFGVTSPYLLLNVDTILHTWCVLAVLCALLIPVRAILRRKKSTVRYIILAYVHSFITLIEQSLGSSINFRHISFIIGLFTFILVCNIAPLIPGLYEPTKDLNTTLALGIISFLYTHGSSIEAHGIKEYLKEYMRPFFVMFPLHLSGQLATIISLSFRLFGNIFGGFTISHLYLHAVKQSFFVQLAGIVLGVNLLITFFFVLFEGFLQAFVFSILSLTYLSLALSHEAETEGNYD